MNITSLGFRTDLALLQLGGSEVEDFGDHLVIRSPHNPTFWWGNFLLLSHVPPAAETDRWLERFAAEFPTADHVAIGFDGVAGQADMVSGFTARGMRCDAGTVMQATDVHEPPRPNLDATYRRLRSDADWAQSLELRVACNDDQEPAAHLTFATDKVATTRRMVEAGHGAWFGGFDGDQLITQLGLFAASPGLARFQAVETHPEARGRGLAGTLVHHASQYGFAELGAKRLVMVADPDYVAVRIYRSVGFSDGETQLHVERKPDIN